MDDKGKDLTASILEKHQVAIMATGIIKIEQNYRIRGGQMVDAIGYTMNAKGELLPTVAIECKTYYNPSILKQIHMYAKSLKLDYAIVITPDIFLWHKVTNEEIIPILQAPDFKKYDIRPRLAEEEIQNLIDKLRNKGFRPDQQMQVFFDIFLLHFYKKESTNEIKGDFLSNLNKAYQHFSDIMGNITILHYFYDHLDQEILLKIIEEWAIYEIEGRAVIKAFDLISQGLGRDDSATPQVIRDFMRDLILAANKDAAPCIIDIASSYGGLLNTLQAGIPSSTVTGIEINPNIAQYARILSLINKENRFLNADSLPNSPLNITGKPRGFDIVASCPPFGVRFNPPLNDPLLLKARPRGSADELWVSRAVESLRPGGLGVILVPEGILSRSQAFEMRTSFLNECALEGIISLPAGAYRSPGMRSSILVFRRKSEIVRQRDKVFVAEVENLNLRSRKENLTNELKEVVDKFTAYQRGEAI